MNAIERGRLGLSSIGRCPIYSGLPVSKVCPASVGITGGSGGLEEVWRIWWVQPSFGSGGIWQPLQVSGGEKAPHFGEGLDCWLANWGAGHMVRPPVRLCKGFRRFNHRAPVVAVTGGFIHWSRQLAVCNRGKPSDATGWFVGQNPRRGSALQSG